MPDAAGRGRSAPTQGMENKIATDSVARGSSNDKPDQQPQPLVDSPRTEEDPMLYCPVCSTRLASLKCKLICEKCGYYMSCADYY
jgi:hypothetical protein